MTKIEQKGAAQRLAKLTADIQNDLSESLERMSAEEFSVLLDEEWANISPGEQARLLWIAQKMPRKVQDLLGTDRSEATETIVTGRRLAAGTSEVSLKHHTEPFYALQLGGRELLVAVALKEPQEIVLIGQRNPKWKQLIIGKRRYSLKTTSDANVCRCKGLSRGAFEDAVGAIPQLEIAIV